MLLMDVWHLTTYNYLEAQGRGGEKEPYKFLKEFGFVKTG